ncbi:hypothetical protein APHAL10511_005685 [Amanita phalloides]|nr:hypothetical protein APHAL10511_005685 [Amanita phalloides]
MLTWAATRSQWLALKSSVYAARIRTYASAGVVHPSWLRRAHQSAEHVEDGTPAEAVKTEGRTPSRDVFEDFADEYMVVASASKPRRPSVMEVIDTTLPALLPQPAVDGASIFEEESCEYKSMPLTSGERHQSLDDVLLRMLAAEEYDEAYRILLETKALGQRIQSHPAFEVAAIATLDHIPSSNSPQAISEQLTRFETFFRLIPSSDAPGRVRQFNAIRKRILDTPLVNMDLIIRFSLILIRKGYLNLVQRYTIPFITRFASSEVCLQFVDDAIVANKLYRSSYYEARQTSWGLRRTVIYRLAVSGRVTEAISLLPRDGSPMEGFRLSPKAHAMLRYRLERSSEAEHHDLIPYVDSLLFTPVGGLIPSPVSRNNEESSFNSPPTTAPGFKGRLMDRSTSVAHELEGSEVAVETGQPIQSLPGTLAKLLRQVKAAYISSAPSGSLFTQPPALIEVLSFFTSYMASVPDRNGRAIHLLRRRAFKVGPGLASHFLFAEMLYYYRCGMPELVLETYVDHFYVSAVPREDVLALYHEFFNRRLTEWRASLVSNVQHPFRIGLSGAGPSLSTVRLWPATGHTSLVWHALVMLVGDDRILQLYQKLLQIASGSIPFSTSSQFGKAYSTSLLPPPTWHAKVPASAFTPFIRRMLKISNHTSLGASLLNDMVRAGVEPNVHHLTEFAQFYAQRGDSRRACIIMEEMEATEKAKLTRSNDRPASAIKSARFPSPDIVFYCALLRAFIFTRNLDGAEQVAQRILEFESRSAKETVAGCQYEIINKLWQDLSSLRAEKREGSIYCTTERVVI